jgi:hypothetical protein
MLRVLAASGESATAIARRMKRSQPAIRKRAVALKIVLAKERGGWKAIGK